MAENLDYLKRENETLKRENELLRELLEIKEKQTKPKKIAKLKARKKFTKEIN